MSYPSTGHYGPESPHEPRRWRYTDEDYADANQDEQDEQEEHDSKD